MYTRNEKIVPIYIEDEVKDSYLNYAMSVIVGRALPDARDGLKPVHRRILYAMSELGLEHTKPFKKCARIVGETLGKYHPHGDVAVYDALVRMAQDFSLRYPLVDGQGNFGSVDGDAAAAMRYTEARLAAISDEMLADIDKDTVNFGPNFDASLEEPLLLPASLPNLLVNGSSGIAVGMATNIPPHNLNEVADAIIYIVEHPEAEAKDLMRYIKGPDFPTGGVICGRNGIKEAYTTGKGKLTVRARATVEHQKSGKDLIVITEIPYQVQKSGLIESIAGLVDEKKLDGISDIRDESDKEGMRIVVELKRDAESQIVLNQLFKHTQLETTFGIIMLALVENRPRVLNLRQMLDSYIEHRKVIIRRRTQFELDKALKRAHILEGLKIALKFIDRIIKVIKTSKNVENAKERLMKEFGLSAIQSQAILEMQLQRLTALERDKIDAEYLELLKRIELCKAILASEKKIEGIIKEELEGLKKKYGDERRTDIVGEIEELEVEDLADLFLRLQAQGCHNLDLVSPTTHLPFILKALEIAIPQGLRLPLVYNTHGYLSETTLDLLEGVVDIYLPDMKYGDDQNASRLSQVEDYTLYNQAAIRQMFRQVGPLTTDEQGLACRGLLVRHLVLPENQSNSREVLRVLASVSLEIPISLMAQYRPGYQANRLPEINRLVYPGEYEDVLALAEKLAFEEIIIQDMDSARIYYPDFIQEDPFETEKIL